MINYKGFLPYIIVISMGLVSGMAFWIDDWMALPLVGLAEVACVFVATKSKNHLSSFLLYRAGLQIVFLSSITINTTFDYNVLIKFVSFILIIITAAACYFTFAKMNRAAAWCLSGVSVDLLLYYIAFPISPSLLLIPYATYYINFFSVGWAFPFVISFYYFMVFAMSWHNLNYFRIVIAAIFLVCAFAIPFLLIEKSSKVPNIAIIHGNINYKSRNDLRKMINILSDLPTKTITVTPENFSPISPVKVPQRILIEWTKYGRDIIFGSLTESNKIKKHNYNSAYHIAHGEIIAEHRKTKLMPLEEKFKILRWPKPTAFTIYGEKIQPLIGYEVMRAFLPQYNTDIPFIYLVMADARGYGDMGDRMLRLASQALAASTNRYVALATNNGESAIFDSYGNMILFADNKSGISVLTLNAYDRN